MSKFVLTAQLQLQAPSNVAQVVRQIQSQLNNVSVNVQVQGTAQAQRQIQQISNVTNEATSAAERMGKAFAVSIRRFAAFSIATRAVGLFTSTLSDSIKTAIDFERQLIKVSQVTGESIGKLKTLTSTITKLATDFGVSSQSLLDVSTILLQAGVSSRDTEVALKSLAKAALAPNFDSITETAEGAIAILAQFKLGVGALEDQLGSINAVAGAFAVEASDLIDVIRRTGGVFKSSGGDLNELLALFTSVRATTRESAESIGTGLRTIFTRIQRPKTIEYLKQFGVELTDLNGKFVGPYEAVRKLSSALVGLGEGDITFIRVAEELGGFRQIGKVLPLLQQFQTAEAALNIATKANNSLTKDAAIAQESLAIRIVKVKEEFLALVRSVTETTTFQVMANTALTLASALIRIGDAIKPLIPLLAAVASFRALSGIGKFVGSVGSGLTSGKTFNKGGKVHHFATGGLVPGSGSGDTVPAMLSPGEFVIRKSSVQSLGASNLAGMNHGGTVQKFAFGGQARKFGIASLTPMDKPLEQYDGQVTIDSILKVLARDTGLKTKLNTKGNINKAKAIISKSLGVRGVDSVQTSAISESFSNKDVSDKIESRVNTSIEKLINNAAYHLSGATGIDVERKADSNLTKSIGTASTIGSIFEGALSLLGAPTNSAKREQDPIDYPNGLGPKLSGVFSSLTGIPVDAKKRADKEILKDTANRKSKNYFAAFVKNSPSWKQFLSNAESTKTKKPAPIPIASAPPSAPPAALESFQLNQEYTTQELKKANLHKERNRYFDTKQGRRWTKREQARFAVGGGVGTDTIPAMLTPGEFVVNKASAQSIGYGNLNRMNKVGKYASGGIVQKFKKGGKTQNVSSGQGAFGLAIGVSAFQSLLPAVEENSGAFVKATNSILQLVTTFSGLVFALDAFGFSLRGMLTASSVRGFKDLSQSATIFGRNIKNVANTTFGGKLSREWQTSIQRLAAGTAQLVAPFAATATAGYIVAQSIYSFNDSINKLNKAIQSGNIAEAEKNSTRARTESLGVGVSAAAGGLAAAGLVAVGALSAPIAIPVGIAVAALTALGLKTEFASDALQDFKSVFGYAAAEQAKANDRLAASTIALQEANKNAAEIAAQSLQDVSNGALTLEEAFAKTEKANVSNFNQQAKQLKRIESTNIKEITREKVLSGPSIMSPYGSVPSFRSGFDPQAPQKVKQEEAKTKELTKKNVLEYLQSNQPLLKEQMIRSASGQSGVGDFTGFLSDLEKTSSNAGVAFSSLSDVELVKFKNEFQNISQAVLEAQKAFDALNLGLSLVKSNIAASSVSVSNFTSSLEFGSSELQRSLDTLNASANGAGESLKSDQIDQALKEVSNNLKRFGADDTQVNKFQDNFRAISEAQRNIPQIIERLKTGLGGLTGIRRSEVSDLRTEFQQAIKEQFKGADPAIVENILNSVSKLSTPQLDQIRLTGDLSVFTDLLSENAKAQLEQIKGVEEVIKINKELSDLTKNRIETERKFIEAQKEAIAIQLEVRDLESKYGGKFLSDAEKRNNLFAKANTGTPQGVSPLVTGSPEELQKRNQEIKQRFLAIEALKQEVANKKMSARDAGMVDAEGEKLKAQYEDLQKANKDQIQTIRDLIKLQEDELKIIKEKNKLEQDSIDSLIKGDLEKFLEQQAAVGATAAIATGSQRLMNAYGADALSGAFADLKRQSEAGVQTAYGQQINGPDGLLEQAARYTLEQRGVTDPILAAKMAASTTSAIETKNTEIRTTAAVLNAAGQTAVDMSKAQLNTADFTITSANIILKQAILSPRTQLEPAPIPNQARALNRGGPVYASNGIFVPRGSDTIPAMLTPGEFVVRREAVHRGNNLQMLQAMNGSSTGGSKNGAIAGFANGGKVQYLRTGNQNPVSGGGFGFDPAVINRLSSSLDSFNRTLSANIDRLNTVKLHLVLDTTNINLNLSGGSFLGKLTEDLKKQLYTFIGEQFNLFGVSGSGKIKENRGIVPRN